MSASCFSSWALITSATASCFSSFSLSSSRISDWICVLWPETFVTSCSRSPSISSARCCFSARVLLKSLKAALHLRYSGSFLTASASPPWLWATLRALAAAPALSCSSFWISFTSPVSRCFFDSSWAIIPAIASL